jgi:hypothetical protein
MYVDTLREMISVINNKTTYSEGFDYLQTKLLILVQDFESERDQESKQKYAKDIRFVMDVFIGQMLDRALTIAGVGKLWPTANITSQIQIKMQEMQAKKFCGDHKAGEMMKKLDEAHQIILLFGATKENKKRKEFYPDL